MAEIRNAKVMILATNGFEQSELMVPLQKLKDAGAQVVVVSPERGQIRGWKHKDWGESVNVDKTIDEVNAAEYDAMGTLMAYLTENCCAGAACAISPPADRGCGTVVEPRASAGRR